MCCLVVSPARASSIWLEGSPLLHVVKLKLECVLPNYYQWCDVGLEFIYSVLGKDSKNQNGNLQGDFFNWASPENVSRLAPPKFAWSGPP